MKISIVQKYVVCLGEKYEIKDMLLKKNIWNFLPGWICVAEGTKIGVKWTSFEKLNLQLTIKNYLNENLWDVELDIISNYKS